LQEAEIKKWLEETTALKKGHFRLSSGLHSDTYVQCALLLKDSKMAYDLGRALKEKITEASPKASEVDTVLCPALGAVVIGYTVALAYGCEMIFAERQEGRLKLRRGFKIEPGQRIVIVEDVITTAGSAEELIEICNEQKAQVAAVACIVDRSSEIKSYEIISLLKLEAESWLPEDCPLCARGIEIDSPGSRYQR